MKHFQKFRNSFLMWSICVSALLLAMSVRLGQFAEQNERLVNELVAEQSRAAYWREVRSVESEDGWAAYEGCMLDELAMLEDEDACPTPHDLCGTQLDICYSYCVEDRPTVQAEHAMCKAWWNGFWVRESRGVRR